MHPPPHPHHQSQEEEKIHKAVQYIINYSSHNDTNTMLSWQ